MTTISVLELLLDMPLICGLSVVCFDEVEVWVVPHGKSMQMPVGLSAQYQSGAVL